MIYYKISPNLEKGNILVFNYITSFHNAFFLHILAACFLITSSCGTKSVMVFKREKRSVFLYSMSGQNLCFIIDRCNA